MNNEASVIYPHQLFDPVSHPAILRDRPVYLVEESLLLTEFPTHTQKLLLHRASLKAFEAELVERGYSVHYLDIRTYPTTDSVFAKLHADKITVLHIVDTTDHWLEKRIKEATTTYTFERITYNSPLFILTKVDAMERYLASKRYLASFYKQMRIDRSILVDTNGKPIGGKWSYDKENRKKIPRKHTLPKDIVDYTPSADEYGLKTWLENIPTEHYGEVRSWIPYTRESARQYLHDFITNRFSDFGSYEDAIDTRSVRLWHSGLSPLLNIGLLSPNEVLTQVLEFAEKYDVPLNSLEGFVRQLIGWREFIRASYEIDGVTMRNGNFFNHCRRLPKSFWDASTGIEPIDHTIRTALHYGYTHHIERLMVLGNFMLLSETEPNEVYRWFMSMYVDAYDWVMVPNVYGMSQFADGGIFATKPYISGGNYLKKMSNYPNGDWEVLYTALYWHFVEKHATYFSTQHRLSMMPKLLERIDVDRKALYLKIAHRYFENL